MYVICDTDIWPTSDDGGERGPVKAGWWEAVIQIDSATLNSGIRERHPEVLFVPLIAINYVSSTRDYYSSKTFS